MPRITRAALRTNIVLDDEVNLATATPLPLTPQIERAPLGEIAGNPIGEVTSMLEVNLAKPVKKVTGKPKKAKAPRKEKKRPVQDETDFEILEDDNQSSTSSAVEEACEELLRDHSQGPQLPMQDQRSTTPPSKATKAARRQLSPKLQTPRTRPAVHNIQEQADKVMDDSFECVIRTRTPARPEASLQNTAEISEKDIKDQSKLQDGDDSFTEHILTRSPLKPAPRMENAVDAIDAIDALEDAIEMVGEALSPVLAAVPPSPLKCKTVSVASKRKATTTVAKREGVSKNPKPIITPARKSVATIAVKRSPVRAPLSTSKPISTPRLRPTTRSSPIKPAPSSVTQVAPRKHVPRVSSISKPPFVPNKSAKPPTTSTFTLPSDAVTAKHRAAREARSLREQAAVVEKRAFKARPVTTTKAPVVKPTIASRARMSLVRGELPSNKLVSSVSSMTTNVDGHTVSKVKPVIKAIVPKTARLSTKPTITTPKRASLAPGTTLSKVQGKGKEVLSREKVVVDNSEKSRKEKEEAARKARVEAAERGRLASREWAERMKARKAANALAGKRQVLTSTS